MLFFYIIKRVTIKNNILPTIKNNILPRTQKRERERRKAIH